MDEFSKRQGSDIPLRVEIRDSQGNPEVYLGTEVIDTVVTLIGGTRSFHPDSHFVDPGAGVILIDMTPDNTSVPGIYFLLTRIAGIESYQCILIITPLNQVTSTTPAPYASSTLVSRYGLIPNDLRIHAMTLSLGDGMATRLGTPDSMRFIIDAERQVEDQVSDFVAVPLKPTPSRPGLTPPLVPNQPSPQVPPQFPPANPNQSPYSPEVSITPQGSKWNFPVEFIQAIIYRSIALMLRSEYFEVEPNTSQVSVEADTRADSYIFLFRSRPTVLVGSGRRRNPNPHMPPNVAPRGNTNIPTPGGRG